VEKNLKIEKKKKAGIYTTYTLVMAEKESMILCIN